MDTPRWVEILQGNLPLAASVVAAVSVILFVFARYGIARWLTSLASHTSSKYDDILVRNVRPSRVAWLAPLIVIYTNAYLFPDHEVWVEKAALFLVLWLSVLTLTSTLNAVNEIYEARKNYNGVSIQSYLDITKILLVLVGLILSVTLLTGESPVVSADRSGRYRCGAAADLSKHHSFTGGQHSDRGQRFDQRRGLD